MASWFMALSNALAAGLMLWQDKNATKYKRKLYKLKEEWNDEYLKKRPNDAILGNIERELRLLCEIFAAEIRGSNTSPK